MIRKILIILDESNIKYLVNISHTSHNHENIYMYHFFLNIVLYQKTLIHYKTIINNLDLN